MKNLLLLVLLLAAFAARAQSPTWGFGLPITATLSSGGTLTCTVTDPQRGPQSYSLANVVRWYNTDGVAACTTSGGNYAAVTYDVNLHQWQTIFGGTSTIQTVQTNHGVVVWAAGSGSYGYASYNPALRQWTGNVNSGTAPINISTQHGVVAWATAQGYGYATYDPLQAQWQTNSSTSLSGTTISTQHGVVAWYTAQSYGMAIFDPTLHQWQVNIGSGGVNAVTQQACDNGVVAWSSSGSTGMAAYNPSRRSWNVNILSSGAAAGSLQIADGTVNFTSGQSGRVYGYDAPSDQWRSGSPTTLYCELRPVAVPNTSFVYFHNLSIGATGYNIACGDGHLIGRRVAWKQYAANNTYAPALTVSNSVTSTTCTASVQVVSASRSAGAAAPALSAVPNPASGSTLVSLPVGTRSLGLLNLLGQCQWQATCPAGTTRCAVPLAGLPPGVYLLRATGAAGTVSTRLAVE